MPDPIRVNRERSVLLLVDIQPDFMPGGALAVEGGDRIVKPVSQLMESGLFDLFVATQDWHPPGHVSFASQHEGKQPFDTIELYGYPQTLWPDHCLQGTKGAELHPDLPLNKLSAIIRKGSDPQYDSYSGFRSNWNPDGRRPATGLAGYLREHGVEDVYLCGLARDVCVKWTAEDGASEGFRIRYLWDLTRSVDPSGDEQLREDLEQRGVEFLTSEQLSD